MKYKIQIDRQTRAVMRDGIELAVVVVRPDSPGTYPAIMSYNPYRTLTAVKSTYSEKEYNHRWDGPSYFSERGYAVVYFDVRGTGNSGGSTQEIYSADEQIDACEMIEWIASQTWSDGNVGMWGMSYGGVVQWQVGVQNPPNLKTLVVGSSNDNVYSDWVYPGGCIRPYMFDTFSPLMTANNFAPPDPELVGEKYSKIWHEHLEKNTPWGIGFLSNALDNDYWKSKSLETDYSRIKIPVMLWSGWADCYPTAILRAYSKLKVPKKVFIGPWGHFWPEEALPGPRIDFRFELLKWFDKWLKGIDTGVMKEPPITIFVKTYKDPQAMMHLEENGHWRHENEWPLFRELRTSMFFCKGGKLKDKSDTVESKISYSYDPTLGTTAGICWGGGIIPWAMPIDQRIDDVKSLSYTTCPLDKDTEITGEPYAVLYIASTAETGYFHVKITDIAPDGTSKWITDGGLLTSHRNSHSTVEPIEPGEIYKLKIFLKYMAYIFPAKHQIGISIASSDIHNAWPVGSTGTHTVFCGGDHSSYINLPFISNENIKTSIPVLKPSPCTLPNKDDYLDSGHKIINDLINKTMTIELERSSGLLPNNSNSEGAFGESKSKRDVHSQYQVSYSNPANVTIKASHIYSILRPEGDTKIEVNEVLTSDKLCFRFVSQVEIRINGKLNFQKSWNHSRLRNFD